MQKLRGIVKIIDFASYWVGYCTMYLTVLISAIMVIEVVARYVFQRPTMWATESTMIAFGIYICLIGAYVLLINGHVRMDALYGRISLRKRAIVNVTTFGFFLLFVGVIFWEGIPIAIKSVVMGEHSQSAWRAPFWPLRIAIPLGAFLLISQGLANFIRDFYFALTGRSFT